MVIAGLLFTVMIGAVKVARDELSALEVVWWRAAVSVPVVALFAWRRGLKISNKKGIVVRSLLGFGAMSCFFTSARGLSLADMSLISKLQPILVAVIAPLALGASERAQRVVWIVLIIGLTGCALIIGPDLQVGNVYGLWALAAAGMSAGAHVTIRALGKTDHAAAIVFWFHVIAASLALTGILITQGELLPMPPASLWPYLVAAGLAATFGQLLITRAYAVDRAAAVAAASYASVIFGFLGDFLVFAEWPTLAAVVGGVLVVGAGLLLIFSKQPSPELSEPAAQ